MTATERMYEELERKGKSGSELCRFLGISTSVLAGWKQQNTIPPAKHLVKISEFLNVSTDYLLTGEKKELPGEEQLTLHDAAGNIIDDQPEAERLLKLRADLALTRRIEEVAQEVYQQSANPHSDD